MPFPKTKYELQHTCTTRHSKGKRQKPADLPVYNVLWRRSHFSSECTTDLTLSRRRSTYVWPTPQNMIGAPDV